MALPPRAADPAAPPPPGALTPRAQGVARILLVAGLAALGLWVLHPFLPALAWAVILAIALGPLYARAERRWPPGRHNLLLPSLFTLAVALVFLLPLVVLGIQAAREAHDVVALARAAEETGLPVPEVVSRLPFGGAQVSAWWAENLSHPKAGADLLHHLDNSTAIGLSRSLRLAVTAEGVETEEQRRLLAKERGLDLQGYLFGRPEAAARLDRTVELRRPARRAALSRDDRPSVQGQPEAA